MAMRKDQLIKLREQYAEAHDLLCTGMFPGVAAGKVNTAIAFLLANHADLDDQIKKMEAAEKATEVPVAAPTDAAPTDPGTETARS